jgi:hypothetical protein
MVIAGAGAAGMAAALAGARAGREVVLLDPRPRLGGTVTHALIHTIGGCLDSEGSFIAGALCRELIERLQRASPLVVPRRIGRTWTYSVPPQLYAEVVSAWLAEEPRIHLQLGCQPLAVDHRAGLVHSVRWRATDGTVGDERVSAAIDCSGDARLTRLADPALVEDAEAPATAGVILVLGGVAPQALRFPQSLALREHLRAAVTAGVLPPACAHPWCDAGPERGQAYVKFALPAATRDAQRALAEAVQGAAAPLVRWLRAEVAGCERARIEAVGSLGERDGGGIVGVYRLSVQDVRSGRSWGGDAGRCSWPIEYWNPLGGVTLEYLAPKMSYEIPLEALQVRGMGNLFAAGRCLSAEPLARASARVVGSCWTMGERAGRAAASVTAEPAAEPGWLAGHGMARTASASASASAASAALTPTAEHLP